jgi:hypothetical protein
MTHPEKQQKFTQFKFDIFFLHKSFSGFNQANGNKLHIDGLQIFPDLHTER